MTRTRSSETSYRDVDEDRCVDCGRPGDEYSHSEQVLCCTHRQRARRAAKWQHVSGGRLTDLAEAIGVGRGFFRKQLAPCLADDGLRQRLAEYPLPRGGLLVVGPAGAHKTHLLAARTIDATSRGFTARLVNWADYCLQIRSTYQQGVSESEYDVLNRYAKPDYLALDDLGVGKIQGGGRESGASILLAYTLLDRRYARGLITDVSANCLPSELAARFDERIARRLEELCTVYPMFA